MSVIDRSRCPLSLWEPMFGSPAGDGFKKRIQEAAAVIYPGGIHCVFHCKAVGCRNFRFRKYTFFEGVFFSSNLPYLLMVSRYPRVISLVV